MSFNHTVTVSYSTGVGSLGFAQTFSAGAEVNIDEDIPANQTDLLVNFAATRANIQSFIIVADQAMTVKTNSSGSPGQTFTLVANAPQIWCSTLGVARNTFFAADITKLYVTNVTAGTLKVRCCVDPTA